VLSRLSDCVSSFMQLLKHECTERCRAFPSIAVITWIQVRRSPYEKRQIRSILKRHDVSISHRDIDTVIFYPAPLDVIDFYPFLFTISSLRFSVHLDSPGGKTIHCKPFSPRVAFFSFSSTIMLFHGIIFIASETSLVGREHSVSRDVTDIA